METRTIVLNLQPRSTIQAVSVSQYDVGVPLSFIIYDGADPASFESGTTVKLQMTRPSGMAVTESCSISGNVVSKSTTLDMTRESGDIEAELRFSKNSVSVGTCNFTFSVEPAAKTDDAIEADTEALREIAQEIHADVAQNTQNAAIASSAASDAQEYATSAQHNADVATAAARSAGTAKDAAVEAARQAQADAQTASQSAQGVVDSAEAAQAAATVATNKATEATTAATTATSAATTATSAKDSAVSAKDSAQTARTAAQTARDAAVSASATAQQAGSDAEAWAVGQRGGIDVPSSDETYQNNAKYYAMQGGGANLAEDFSTSTDYAVGDYVRHNAKIYEFTSAHSAGAWNSSHVTEVKVMDEVSALKDDLSECVLVTPQNLTDAQKLQVKNNLGLEGASSNILPIISMFFDKLMTVTPYGNEYYKFIQQAFGLTTETIKVHVGYGISRVINGSGLYKYVSNAKRMITAPIKVNSLIPLTLKVEGIKAAGLRAGIKYHYTESLQSYYASLHFPYYERTGTDTYFGYDDETYTMINSDNDILLSPNDYSYHSLNEIKYVSILFADAENMSNDLPTNEFNGRIIINGVPYELDFVEDAPFITSVAVGKTLDTDGEIINNEYRALSAFLPFTGNGTTVSFDGSVRNNLTYALRFYYELDSVLYCAVATYQEESGSWKYGNDTFTVNNTLPNGATLLGYCALLFKDHDGDIPIENIDGNIIINGESYHIEEVN